VAVTVAFVPGYSGGAVLDFHQLPFYLLAEILSLGLNKVKNFFFTGQKKCKEWVIAKFFDLVINGDYPNCSF